MNITEKNQLVYKCAKEFLASNLPEGISKADLSKYFNGDMIEWSDLKDVFKRFVYSAQNYQRMPNVIQFQKRETQIRSILKDFDYRAVSLFDEEELYREFRSTFGVTSNDSKQNSWRKWSNSIVDSAKFVAGFKDAEEFRGFVEQFSFNSTTRMALPLLISTKIRGVGFALSCDVLKELGYLDYPKPDVHMIDICVACGLSDDKPYEVFEAIVRMAEDNQTTPYEVDKLLWLICSGNFYLDEVKGKPLKKQFIEECSKLV